MAEPKYNFSNFFTLRGPNKNGSSVQLNVFNGALSFTVWTKAQNKPFTSVPLTLGFTEMFIKLLERAAQFNPGESVGITMAKYNPETRNSDPQGVVTIRKDEQNVYWLEFSVFGANCPPESFMLTVPRSLDFTDKSMTQAERSELGLQSFHRFVTDVLPEVRVAATADKQPPRRDGGKPGGGGNYSGGYNGSNGGNNVYS